MFLYKVTMQGFARLKELVATYSSLHIRCSDVDGT